jgi:hypothetical protein
MQELRGERPAPVRTRSRTRPPFWATIPGGIAIDVSGNAVVLANGARTSQEPGVPSSRDEYGVFLRIIAP